MFMSCHVNRNVPDNAKKLKCSMPKFGGFLFKRLVYFFNPLSPKIDFYVDLLICATSWESNHKFMLLSKIFQATYYL